MYLCCDHSSYEEVGEASKRHSKDGYTCGGRASHGPCVPRAMRPTGRASHGSCVPRVTVLLLLLESYVSISHYVSISMYL